MSILSRSRPKDLRFTQKMKPRLNRAFILFNNGSFKHGLGR